MCIVVGKSKHVSCTHIATAMGLYARIRAVSDSAGSATPKQDIHPGKDYCMMQVSKCQLRLHAHATLEYDLNFQLVVVVDPLALVVVQQLVVVHVVAALLNTLNSNLVQGIALAES